MTQKSALVIPLRVPLKRPPTLTHTHTQVTPEMARAAAESFESMSPDEIRRAAAASGGSGMPNITPEMHKAASEVMNKLSDEEKAKMQAMASQMKFPAGGGMPQITPEMANMVSWGLRQGLGDFSNMERYTMPDLI